MTNRESKNGQPHNVDDHVDDMKRARAHLSQCVVQHIIQHAHRAVGYSRLLSAVNETYCNKQFLKNELNS